MEINVFNNYGEIDFDYQKVINDISHVFIIKEQIEHNMSLVLINNKEIKLMNKQYRDLDYPTDVLSFADEEEGYLGEVFISIDKVKEQAKAYNHSIEREFAFLLTHGILHLLNYDHQDEESKKKMFTKQEEILKYTNYRRD